MGEELLKARHLVLSEISDSGAKVLASEARPNSLNVRYSACERRVARSEYVMTHPPSNGSSVLVENSPDMFAKRRSAWLEIRDAGEAWLTPDIWVVPGTNPLATPGPPLAGQPNYVWARIRHREGIAVSGARVNFYVSPPHTYPRPSTAKSIGAAYVNTAQGEVREVLCLTTWTPPLLVDGHCCLIATVSHASAPLLYPGADDFHVRNDPQVAQRNVDPVLLPDPAGPIPYVSLPIFVGGRPSDSPGAPVEVEASADETPLSEELLNSLRIRGGAARAPSVEFGLGLSRECDPQQLGHRKLKLALRSGETIPVYLRAKAREAFSGYQSVSVRHKVSGLVVGGYTFVMMV
jgi:hypothetical protein